MYEQSPQAPLRLSPGARRHQAATLVELGLVVVLGTLVLMGGSQLLGWVRRSEDGMRHYVEVASQVALANAWLTRDLERLVTLPGELGVEVAAVSGRRGSYPAGALSLRVEADRPGEEPVPVTYTFDPDTGDLTRRSKGSPERAFHLGKAGAVIFMRVDPSYAGGGPSVPGRYNNRLVYRLTGRKQNPPGAKPFTVMGALALEVKASRDTFPFWNSSAIDRPGTP